MGRYAPYISLMLNLLYKQNLKPHDDESEDNNGDSEFDAFAEELDSNSDDLILYD